MDGALCFIFAITEERRKMALENKMMKRIF
jgi:hypothetical protein